MGDHRCARQRQRGHDRDQHAPGGARWPHPALPLASGDPSQPVAARLGLLCLHGSRSYAPIAPCRFARACSLDRYPGSPRGRPRRSPARRRAPGRPGALRGSVTHRLPTGTASGWWGSTAPGSRPCCGSWPASSARGGQVRRGRGSRVGFLEQVPALPPGTVAAAWERVGRRRPPSTASAWAAARRRRGGTSGGQAKRVALARVLAQPAELLVLDEPTNHLDLGAVAWLEQRLLAFRGGLVLVTHDRHLLDRVTTRMLELDRGRAYVHEGGYESYLEAKAEREEQAASAESTRRNLARRELAWLRRGAQARSRKPQARIDAARTAHRGPARGSGPDDRARVARRTPPARRQGDRVRRGRIPLRRRTRWSCRVSTSCSGGVSGWGSSAPTGPASRRWWTCWPDAGSPRPARWRSGRRCGGVLRPAGGGARPRERGCRTWWPGPTAPPDRWPTSS